MRTILRQRPRRFISVAVRGLIFLYILLCALALWKASAALLHFAGGRSAALLLRLLAFSPLCDFACIVCHMTFGVINSFYAGPQYKR